MSRAKSLAAVATGATLALTAAVLAVPASQASSPPPIVAWAHQANPLPVGAGAIYSAASTGVASDASGNTFIVGTFAGQVTLGSFTLTTADPANDTDLFLAKYTPAGDVAWAVRAGGTSTTTVTTTGITVDGAGNIYVAGEVRGGLLAKGIDFGNGVTLVGTEAETSFIAKYSPTGVATWVRPIQSPTLVQVKSLSATAGGQVTFVGRFRTSVITNEITLSPGPGMRGMVGSMTTAGVTTWIKSMSSTSSDALDVLDVAVDSSGNSFVTGFYYEDIDFGEGLRRARSNLSQSPFLTRYAPNGTPMWADGYTTVSRGAGRGVAIDGSGNVVLAGSLNGTLTVGSSTLNSPNDDGCFVARYSATAVGQWAVGCTGTAYTSMLDVATSGSTVYVLGDPRADTTFGGVPLSYPAGSAPDRGTFFVATVSGAGSVLWTEVAGATATSFTFGVGIIAGPGGRPAVTASFAGTIGLGGRTVSTTPDTTDLLVAAYAGAPSIAPETQTLNLATGVAMAPSSALTASHMQAPVTYAVSPVLPAGLTLDTATGVVTGTPTTAQAPVSYTITGTDAGGRTATTTANIGVSTPSLFPASQTLTITTGRFMEPSSPFTPSAMTAPVTYSVSPALPDGLSFSTSAGDISGIPTTVQPATVYTVTGTDSSTPARTATATVSIQVVAPAVTKPGKVTNLKAKAKVGKVIVKWRPPTETGGGVISGYQVRVGKAAWAAQTKLRVNVTSLKKGQKVTVRVRAVNEAGPGPVKTVKSRAR